MGLIESFSVIWLLKNIPDFDEGIFLNKVGVVLQAVKKRAIKITGDERCAMYNIPREHYDMIIIKKKINNY